MILSKTVGPSPSQPEHSTFIQRPSIAVSTKNRPYGPSPFFSALEQNLDLREFDVAVLAAIAYHQPVTRDGLKDIFGKEISRDLIGRLHARGLIGTGPRSPRRGAPYTYVTTEQFLVAFDPETLQGLPDREQFEDAGMSSLD